MKKVIDKFYEISQKDPADINKRPFVIYNILVMMCK